MIREIKLLLLGALLVFGLNISGQEPGSFKGYRVGRYEGTALNTTFNLKGKVVFEISQIEQPSGQVSAHFIASNGLTGEGWLTGRIDENGRMTLSGNILDWKMSVQARLSGDATITATYTLQGSPNQQGEFSVRFRGLASPVLAKGAPPLTQEMADKFLALYEFELDLKLSAGQHDQLQSLMVEAWKKNGRVVIGRVMDDLKAVGEKSKDELKSSLGADYQVTLVEGIRRGGMQTPLLRAFVELFDQAHPDRVAATRAKGFADLVGTWRREDSLMPSVDRYTGTPTTTSFTDARTLAIAADGHFKHVQSHNHCSGGVCCRMWGSTELGTVRVEGAELVFEVKSGDKFTRDSCSGLNLPGKIEPHRESVTWTIRPNPHLNNAPALCWTTEAKENVCYNKQR